MPLIYHGFSELTMSHFGFNSKVGRHVATISFSCILRMAYPFCGLLVSFFVVQAECCSISQYWWFELMHWVLNRCFKQVNLCFYVQWYTEMHLVSGRSIVYYIHIVAIKVYVWRGISELGHDPGVPKQTSTLHGGFDQRIDHLRLPEGLQSAEFTGCDVDM